MTKVNEVLAIEKALAVAEDLAIGVGKVKQKRPSGVRELTQINSTVLGGPLVVDSLTDLKSLDPKALHTNSVIVMETGQLYYWDREWKTPSAVSYTVKSVDELEAISGSVGAVNVSDPVRGGVFYFVESLKLTNDGGTVFNGWVRAFKGEVNAKWFGALGDGANDDTEALNKALAASLSVFMPEGRYRVTDTLSFQERGQLRGLTGSIVVSEARVPVFKMATYSALLNVEVQGQRDAVGQIGVLVNGGASLGDVTKTKIIGCNFRDIGGYAYKIESSSNLSHEVVSSSFSNCIGGVLVERSGEGLSLTSVNFDSCNTALEVKGPKVKVVNCSFSRNTTDINFTEGDSGQASFVASNCVFSDSSRALVTESSRLTGARFVSCIFDGRVEFVNSNGFVFDNCSFVGVSILFNGSDNNIFRGCDISSSSITHDGGGSKTFNHFIQCFRTDDIPDKQALLEGGSVSVFRDSDLSLTQSGFTTLVFNQVTYNSRTTQPNFTKGNYYDPVTGIFDFTLYKGFGNEAQADIKLCLGSSNASDSDNIDIYIYRIDQDDDKLDTNVSQDKILGILSKTTGSFPGKTLYSFSGSVPKVKFRLVAKNNNRPSQKLLAEGTTFVGSGKSSFRAIFSGI